MKKLKVFEAFAGIGAQHRALDKIKFNYEMVGISEWEVDAIIAYDAIHNGVIKDKEIEKLKKEKSEEEIINYLEQFSFSSDGKVPMKKIKNIRGDKKYRLYLANKRTNNFVDISKMKGNELPKIDLFTYSFPCQDLSMQGKQKGLREGSSSSLLWEVERILKELKSLDQLPKYLMMENVKGILGIMHKEDFLIWKQSLEKLGYKTNRVMVLNAKHFNVPQNRERVFMFSSLDVIAEEKFEKVEAYNEITSRTINSILSNDVPEKYNLTYLKPNIKDDNPNKLPSGIRKGFLENYTNFNSENYIYFEDGICATLTASGAQSRLKFITKDGVIRRMQPEEAYKFMGFTEQDFKRVLDSGISENKILKQAGNSIVVNILEEIFKILED